ncbi:OLC1v1012956C1 [Oldenlandia corymbosa var. corymbosa]|uniref:OLC1v1012956C1 n=1 Tax=Oldenlandia corymbosa var. corymbosa TaxID=529605 RepID=A0AAV1E0D5_OLDCO|nr:OLC1v1012956C1 [Oldenlandia corymbosa var. corymbosa]
MQKPIGVFRGIIIVAFVASSMDFAIWDVSPPLRPARIRIVRPTVRKPRTVALLLKMQFAVESEEISQDDMDDDNVEVVFQEELPRRTVSATDSFLENPSSENVPNDASSLYADKALLVGEFANDGDVGRVSNDREEVHVD